MSGDIWILFLLLVINLLLIGCTIKINRYIGVINVIILLIYSIPLFYILFNSTGGMGLVWWFYLLVILTSQNIVLFSYIIFKWIKK